jgi:hypothetical protein
VKLRAGILAIAAATLGAQGAPAIKLAPAAAKLSTEFSSIVAVRELADGRVLVADVTENKLVVADFASGSVAQIGRSGQGPGEYQNPRSLLRLGGDSTLLIEQRTSRWHLLHGSRIVATVPADNPAYVASSRQALGADARGNVARTSAFADNKSASVPANGPDSLWLLRTNRGSGRVDTVARLKAQKSVISTSTNARGEVTGVSIFMPPFSAAEQIAMFEDGWLAIARMEPYRVDWVAPDGRSVKGRSLPWTHAKVTERDVEAYYAVRSRATSAPSTQDAEARRKQIETAMKQVPELMPPFVPNGLIPAEDGTVLVRHPDTADQPNARYDIVDRAGRLLGMITMAKGETISAVSKKWAYVIRVDDDGLNFLSRHPWIARAVAP